MWEANPSACELLETSADRLVDAALLEKVPLQERRQLLESVRETVMGRQPQPYTGTILTSTGSAQIKWELASIGSDVRGVGWARCILRPVPNRARAAKPPLELDVAPSNALLAELRAVTQSEAQLQKQAEEYRRHIADLERQLSSARAAADRTVFRMTELQKQLDARLADLRASNGDIAALGYFAATKLHEPVRSMSRLLASIGQDHSGSASAENRAYVAGALTHCESLDRLLSALCDFCQVARHPVRLEDVDMTRIFKTAAEKLADEGLAQRCSVHVGDLGNCTTDADLLAIVAEELLSNAMKFSSVVASPVVEVSKEKLDASARKPGQMAWTVRDNGPGFPMSRARRLFVPMGCIEPQDKGSGAGLGLATVRRIVQKLGGRVWAESLPGMGASFSFTVAAEPKPQRK